MLKKKFYGIFLFFLICLPVIANEEGKVEALKKTIDVSKLSGFNLFLANLYNENMWLYAIVSILSMALLGVILGGLTESLLAKMGLKTSKMEHKE